MTDIRRAPSGDVISGSVPSPPYVPGGLVSAVSASALGVGAVTPGQFPPGLNFQRCRVTLAADIPAFANLPTPVPWDVNVYDTNGWHSTTVNPTRFTFSEAGIYFVAANLVQLASNVLAIWDIRKNGAATPTAFINASNSVGTSGQVFDFVQANPGDYVEIFCDYSGGVTFSSRSWATVWRVG